MASGEVSTSQPGKVSTSQPGKVSTSQPGKTLSTSGLPMEGWLDINTDCQSGTDKWNTTNLQRRYCKLQRLGDSLSLEVYSDKTNTKPIHTLSLFKTQSKDTASEDTASEDTASEDTASEDTASEDTASEDTASEDTARNAFKLYRGQVVTEDGTVLCVMEGDERVSEWVDSLNSVIKPATSDTDGKMKTEGNGVRQTADSTTHTAATSDGEDHVPRQLSEEPEVIKVGWLKILTDPAPGEDKLDNMQTKYCSLQRQGGRYSLEVYKGENDVLRYERNSDNYTCLDTARHAQLCSRYEVVTMDGRAIFVMDGTDDVMTDWVVSLNRAIMAARCPVTVAGDPTIDGKRNDQKPDYCLFCKGKYTSKMSSHLLSVHCEEARVQAVTALPCGSKERERVLGLLQDEGNRLHNSEDEFLNAWFPVLDTKSCIIPVVHYETVHGYDDYNVGGHNVIVLQTDRERKIQHCIKNEKARVAKSVDDVLKRVHDSMTLIQDNEEPDERFVIMTEVKCALYNSLYAGAADRNNDTQSNTHSSQASKVEWDMKDGLTDLLVIHRDHGLLLGAVTRNTGSDPNALRKDLRKAVAYLHRAEVVVKDVIPAGVREKSAVTINKTILLPNLTRQNLTDTLCNTPQHSGGSRARSTEG